MNFLFMGFVILWVASGVVLSKNRGLVSITNKKINHHFLLPLVYLLYMGLEIYRGYFLMHVVHYWLVDDIGLIIGLLIWLLGIGFPVLVPTSYRTPVWLSILGVYWYLFQWCFG